MRRSCAFPGELQHRLSQAHSLVAVLIVHLRSHTALEQGSIKTDVKRNTSPEQIFEHCSASSPGGFHSLVHPRQRCLIAPPARAFSLLPCLLRSCGGSIPALTPLGKLP